MPLLMKPKYRRKRLVLNANSSNYDPTRTGALRRKYNADMTRRFNMLRQRIIQLIYREDALGLNDKPVFNGEFSSTQLTITNPLVIGRVRSLQAQINPDDVIELDDTPHVTVRYGLHTQDGNRVAPFINGSDRIHVRLGTLGLFSSDTQDVLKISVSGPKLHDLNARLRLSPNTDNYPTYQPHMTIAYLKPGTGKKYIQPTPLTGTEMTFKDVTFSDKTRQHELIALNAKRPFHTSSQKIEAFKQWLIRQVASTIFAVSDKAKGYADDWFAWYAEEGYKKGAGRAFDAVRKAPVAKAQGKTDDWYKGGKDEFLKSSFGHPVAIEKIKLLAGRTFNDLKGVTDGMAAGITHVLTDGLVQGKSPREVARDMTKVVDINKKRALTIARTETIRAHAQGQLDALKKLNVEHVGVAVEWDTSHLGKTKLGNPSPCKVCAPLQGVVMTLKEADGLIPRHPNCMCSLIPANVGEDKAKQLRTQTKIIKAFGKSVRAERGKKATLKSAVKRSKWIGAKRKIMKSRPISVLDKPITNTFEGHQGRPGHQGGSLPKGMSGVPEGFPDSMDDPPIYIYIKTLPGSTGAKLIQKGGKKYVMKKGTSPEHLRAEFAAEKAYRAVGVLVPQSHLYETPDGPVKLSEYLEDTKTLDQLSASEKKDVHAQLRAGFTADAVLANWDVIGMQNDNVLVTPDGLAYRIDVGGSLDFRAKGKPKGAAFGTDVGEMTSLRDKYKNPTAHAVFGGMSNDEIKFSAGLVSSHLQPMLDALPDQYKQKIASRAVNALNYANALPVGGGPVERKKATNVIAAPATGKPMSQMPSDAQQIKPLKPLSFKVPQGSVHPTFNHPDKIISAMEQAVGYKNVTNMMRNKVTALNPNGVIGSNVIMPGMTPPKLEKIKQEFANHSIKVSKTHITKKHLLSGSIQITGPKAGTVHAAVTQGQKFTYSETPKIPNQTDKFTEASNKLTNKELDAINAWKGSAKSIRKSIAEGATTGHAPNLLSSLDKLPRFNGHAYRGVSGKYAQEQMEAILEKGPGSYWFDHAPMGLSRRPTTGLSFASNDLLFKVHLNDGRMIESLGNSHHSEAELLSPHGSKFKILGVHQSPVVNNAKLKMLVEMVQLSDDEAKDIPTDNARFAINATDKTGDDSEQLPIIGLEEFMAYVTIFTPEGELVWPPTIDA